MSARLFDALRNLRHAPSSGRAEALFRVAFAFVLLVELLLLQGDLQLFYSTESPSPPGAALAWLYTPTAVSAWYFFWLGSCVLLLLGLGTRAAAIACFLSCLYFIVLRQPKAEHAPDWLIPSLAFHLALMPSNRYLALDRRWRALRRDGPVAAWPLRLAQLSLAFFYFTAGTSKLGDPAWRHGKGFFMTFANPALSHLDLTWLATQPVLSPAINYAVVAWECSMPLLLLFRRTRLFAVLSALVFLLAIDLDLPVGWFAWLAIANLFVFADELDWPRAFTSRFSWLRAPRLPEQLATTHLTWRDRLVTAFIVFHLTCFAWMQLAYGFLAAERYDVGYRLAALPVLGTYGYGVANVRYYALWPSQFFYPVHVVYLEGTAQGGEPHALPPFDDQARPHIGWLESRRVREAMMLMKGMPESGLLRYFGYVRERYSRDYGRCLEQLAAYQLTVQPGSFGQDLRKNRVRLAQARYRDCPAKTANKE